MMAPSMSGGSNLSGMTGSSGVSSSPSYDRDRPLPPPPPGGGGGVPEGVEAEKKPEQKNYSQLGESRCPC